MAKFIGVVASENALVDVWTRILEEPPDTQRIIHVLTPRVSPEVWTTTDPYKHWEKGGPNTVTESLALLQEVSRGWYYFVYAREARRRGIANVRIIILPRDRSHPCHRYSCEVFWPFMTAKTRETIIVVDQEDYEAAGFSVLDYDINIWGRAIMLTSYGLTMAEDREFIYPGEENFLPYASLIGDILQWARDNGTVIQPAKLPT